MCHFSKLIIQIIHMSKASKTLLILIVLIAIIAIIWTYLPKSNTYQMNQQTSSQSSGDNYVASTTDTSDAAINQDMSDLDTQLNQLNSDQAVIDSTSTNQ